VDFENAFAAELIRSANSDRTRPVLAVALASNAESTREALLAGATLVLSKPLSRDKGLSGVRVARNFVIQEKRKMLRIPLQADMRFVAPGKKPVYGIAVNVSQGGVGFRMEQPPQVGEIGELRFTLPGRNAFVIATVETTWTDADKKTGGFSFKSLFSKHELTSWIATRCDNALADSPAESIVTYRN